MDKKKQYNLNVGDVLKIHQNSSNPYNDKMKNREVVIKKMTKLKIILAPKSACYKQPDGTYKIQGKDEFVFNWVDFTNFETTGINLFEKPKKRGRKKS